MFASADSTETTGWILGAALVCAALLLLLALKVIKPLVSLGASALSIFH